jgi:oxygen-independent coproporphyrinogen-3 oxidase
LSDVYAAIDAVTASGLPSWSLDLISGLPGLKMAGWQHSLEQAVAAGPDHISVYDLQVKMRVDAHSALRCTALRVALRTVV